MLFRSTTLPFLMGQMLPDNAEYNFKGIIDEVKLFDYALAQSTALTLYQQSVVALHEAVVFNKEKIHISPNPVSDKLVLTLPFSVGTKLNVSVLSVNGQIMLEKSIYTEGGYFEMNVSALLSGIYIVTVQSDKQKSVARFVKL